MSQNKLTSEDKKHLSLFIQKQHLNKNGIEEIIRNLGDCPEQYVQIDNFLNPTLLDPVQGLILRESKKIPIRRVKGKNYPVSEELFFNSPESDRWCYLEIFDNVKKEFANGKAIKMHLALISLFGSSRFKKYVSLIFNTKTPLVKNVTQLMTLKQEHFLKKHDDSNHLVCMTLYLNKSWRSEYGGRFNMYRKDGGHDFVEPLFNRALLFNPTIGTSHEVEDLTEDAGNRTRINYVTWFD